MKKTSAIIALQVGDLFKYILVDYDGYPKNPGVGHALVSGFPYLPSVERLMEGKQRLKTLRSRHVVEKEGTGSELVDFPTLLGFAETNPDIKFIYVYAQLNSERYDWMYGDLSDDIELLDDLESISFFEVSDTVDPEDVEVSQFCSFSTAANWLGKYILFNKAPELDTWLLEEVSVEGEDEEGELIYREFFQFYMTDLNDEDVEWMNKNFPDLIYAYSEELEKWILCVDHYGTSWDYVSTRFVGDLLIPETDKIFHKS